MRFESTPGVVIFLVKNDDVGYSTQSSKDLWVQYASDQRRNH